MTPREAAALHIDPYSDGKGDDYYRVFSNKIVTTRKPADCVLCFEHIPVGSRVRAQTEQSDDYGVKTFRFCPACVEAMAAYGLDDEFEALEKRYALGMAHAERQRQIEGAHER